MYRLMIVDDEYNIRNGIQEAIPWESIGVEVVGCAVDGVDALEKIPVLKPDIVVTDVKMDRMDGLTLIDEATTLYPFVKFIVLSGYDDSEFIRRSLELKVFSYLLKPVGAERLLEVTQQQIAELDKENRLRTKINALETEFNRNRGLLTERLLRDLLDGKIENRKELADRADFLQLSFAQPYYFCVLFSIDEPHDSGRGLSLNKIRGLYSAIEEIVTSVWPSEAWPVHGDQDKLIVILGGDDGNLQPLDRIVEDINRFLDITFVATTGKLCGDIMQVWESHEQAQITFERNIISEISGLIDFSDGPDAEGMRFTYPLVKEQQLVDRCLNLIGGEDIDGRLTQWFDAMERQHCSRERMRIEIAGILGMLFRKAMDIGVDLYQFYGRDLPDTVKMMGTFKERGQIEGWLREILLKAREHVCNGQKNHITNLIKNATLYLENNYCDYAMSLGRISDYLHVNSSYFSRLYKKEKGINFVEALTQMRMEKAKVLLRGTSDRIADIADTVGYPNAKHFCTLFKKNHGCSPSEYREML